MILVTKESQKNQWSGKFWQKISTGPAWDQLILQSINLNILG